MESAEDRAAFRRTLETSIRLGIVALLAIYCFQVVRPFLQPVLSGAILAIALHPVHSRLARALGGRGALAAGLIVVVLLSILTVPTVLMAGNVVESSTTMAQQMQEGTLRIPPPPANVADWPLVGDRLFALWKTASENLETAIREARPVVRPVGRWLLGVSAAGGMGIAIFALAIGIAGAFLAYTEAASAAARRLARRVVPDRGDALVDLSRDTVAGVTRGILGVALIQAIMSGIGMLAAGVPAAGLWSLLLMMMAVVQIPSVLLLGPAAVWVFAHQSTAVAIAFAVWSVVISLSDNVLKPLLLGRGSSVPTLVIFMGAIGGFILEGIMGLFVGAVALAVGYTLFEEWLAADDPAEPAAATASEAPLS